MEAEKREEREKGRRHKTYWVRTILQSVRLLRNKKKHEQKIRGKSFFCLSQHSAHSVEKEQPGQNLLFI